MATPCMNPLAWRRIVEIVESMPNCSYLEWGSGYSTIELSKIEEVRIVSIEDNGEWYNKVINEIGDNVDYYYCPDDYDYINVDDMYDIILVDGVYRDQCMHKARSMDSWKYLMMHDVEPQRPEYYPLIEMFDEYESEMVDNLWICKRNI